MLHQLFWRIFTFNDFQVKNDVRQLVPKGIGLLWYKHPAWTSPSIIPNRHGLVQACNPRALKHTVNVCLSLVNQLSDLPKPVFERLFFFVGVFQRVQDIVEPVAAHPTVQSIGHTTSTVDLSGTKKLCFQETGTRCHKKQMPMKRRN